MSKAYADTGEVCEYNSMRPLTAIDVSSDTSGPSMTRQEFADECDINTIMARYEKTGMLPVNNFGQPQYVDFQSMPDNLQAAMHMMMEAETAFMTLPAAVRKEFDNDPSRFVEFASDGANLERLREWGLAPPEAVPEPPMRVEVVNPPADPQGRQSEAGGPSAAS